MKRRLGSPALPAVLAAPVRAQDLQALAKAVKAANIEPE